ncbi:ABC transporter permease [Halobacteriovorax sp. HLS]|uniref:ABC transporter permease n=1 Tax=Halobacteriovorax sp. HLS TaxID=2234000 RepID=UPI000FD7CC0C|nr:ABC transporter permease [Halobacteriovorax sp. HLS]
MKKNNINKEMKIGSILIAAYLFWALGWIIYSNFIMGSISSPYFPKADMTLELLNPGTKGFFLGTDIYGRSIIEILSAGLSYSLGISLLVSITSATIGICIGYLSITGNKTIKVLSDLVINLIFIFPSILIAIMVMSVIGQSFWGLVFALIITGWPGYARIARGETMRVMGLTYVESARAIGITELRLFLKVIVPSILPLMMVHIVLGVSGVIISEAALGFLGLGGSEYSWGAMLSIAKTVLLEAPYIVIILSIVMAGLIIGLNLLGDGLRDYLDPRKSFSS